MFSIYGNTIAKYRMFLVKFMNFDPLLSPCPWLVKWHKCISVNYVIMGITEKFYLFCNFRASCSMIAPAVLKLFWTCFEIAWTLWNHLCIEYLNCDIKIDCWLLNILQQNKLLLWTVSRAVLLSVLAVVANMNTICVWNFSFKFPTINFCV